MSEIQVENHETTNETRVEKKHETFFLWRSRFSSCYDGYAIVGIIMAMNFYARV